MNRSKCAGRLSAALLAVMCAAGVSAAEAKRTFRAERNVRGDENVSRVQPIDSAAWIWADMPPIWQNQCIGRVAGIPRDIVMPRFFRFSKTFAALGVPLRIDVSADERFILLLDGKEFARGPHRGMPERWFYHSYEIDVEPGEHVLEAIVWQMGAHAPLAQLSWRGGFVLKAEGAYDSVLTTGKAEWKVAELSNTEMTGKGESRAWGVGSECKVKGTDLLSEKTSAAAYAPAVVVKPPVRNDPCGLREGGWILFPTAIPDLMHEKRSPGRFVAVRSDAFETNAFEAADASHAMVAGFNGLLSSGKTLTVPPDTSLRAVWDLGDYYCAYPKMKVSGGAESEIRWKWTESLLDSRGRKGDRARFAGKSIGEPFGDVFLPDGRKDAAFSSPWWRCGRWCQIEIKTGSEPLRLESLWLLETRYPFEPEASFECDDPSISGVRRICLRAMQMCMHDMTFDCPYYEQHMYPGDSRVQYLISGAINGDSRLVRQCINLFAEAQRPNGMIPMNFPSRMTQESCTYTMCWVDMFRDYLMWRSEKQWVRSRLPDMRRALDGISAYETETGLVASMPGWNFSDYTIPWRNGLPPYGKKDSLSAIENLQYLYALRSAADVEKIMGEAHFARHYSEKADALASKIRETFWSDDRGMLADTTDFTSYSELVQSFAILSDVLDTVQLSQVLKGLEEAKDLTPATPYSSHYLFEAYFAAGRSDLFFRRLDLWRRYVSLNMSTLQESPERKERDPRSDCHAWGAHPLYHLQANVAGVQPAKPCFETVRIRPQPGPLKWLKASAPTPKGMVELNLRFFGEKVAGAVVLPQGMTGTFEWCGMSVLLKEGKTDVTLNPEDTTGSGRDLLASDAVKQM